MTALYETSVAAARKANPLARFSISLGRRSTICKDLEQCFEAFDAYKEDVYKGVSAMLERDGVISINGRDVARVSYNGRVWDMADEEIVF